jgi:hypothetical protein
MQLLAGTSTFLRATFFSLFISYPDFADGGRDDCWSQSNATLFAAPTVCPSLSFAQKPFLRMQVRNIAGVSLNQTSFA